MPAQTDLDLALRNAALKTDEACTATRELSRQFLPIHDRGLVQSAVRHLDVAQESLFKVANLPREKPAAKSRQLSMEVL